MARGLLAYYETYDYCIELASGVLSSGGELVNRARNEAKNYSRPCCRFQKSAFAWARVESIV